MSNKPNKKEGRLLGTALFALYPTLFSFAFNVLFMIKDGTSVGQALLNTVICWGIFWYICYALMDLMDGLRESANRPREEDPNVNSNTNQAPKDQHRPEDGADPKDHTGQPK